VSGEASVIVVDFPKQALSSNFDCSKVVLAVQVIVLVEGVELCDGVQDRKLAGEPRAMTPVVMTSTPPVPGRRS
jgi:hypothetical protein